MKTLTHLLQNNRDWANQMTRLTPDFFAKLAQQQTPPYLWIGCSDSRVPATQLVGLDPGEMFVHRNVANLVTHTDFNCLSVLQYAVEVLQVKHIIVCGHYGCGGVKAALQAQRLGLIDNWLRHLQDIAEKHAAALHKTADEEQRLARLCELNVIEQTINVCQTTIVQDAWTRGQELFIHGWIYGLQDGLVRDMQVTIGSRDALWPAYQQATAAYL
ncbi:MAG: carbonate dehydratase [Acidobacteria bacterium]|nr:carbonate dehydratase [Acidobacteriota bacterium]MBI3423059.1 carbonate dehydratase [Acidobacteriota bacterium]